MGERSLHGAPARFAGGLVEIADRTHAWLQPNGDWGESNAGLVVGDGEALLVDSLWDLRLTARMLEAMRAVTEEPIRTIANTHGDGDHIYGNQLLPDAEVVCCDAAAHDVAHENPKMLARFRRLTAVTRRVPLPPAAPLSGFVHSMLAPYDFSGISVRTPDRTFASTLTLDVGGRTVELERVGPAHTDGDTIVRIPDVGTIFAGDVLFVGVTPNAWSGPISSWRRALQRIIDHAPSVVVPGHGPVCGLEEVAQLDRYWAWLEEEAGALLASGLDVASASEALLLGDDFRGRPWAGWDSPERTFANVLVLDRERRGLPSTAITHAERPKVMKEMAKLARRVRSAMISVPSTSRG